MSQNPKLNSDRVTKIFMDCLFQEEENKDNPVIAEGVVSTVWFHPIRLESYIDEIEEMLNELPEEFHEKTGGGWTFLNACNDKHGNQWTGVHKIMEQLFQLGIGIGKVECLTITVIPRYLWVFLPGEVPYYTILLERKSPKKSEEIIVEDLMSNIYQANNIQKDLKISIYHLTKKLDNTINKYNIDCAKLEGKIEAYSRILDLVEEEIKKNV